MFETPLAAKVIHGRVMGENRKQNKSLFFGVCFQFVIWASFMNSHCNLGSKKPCRITPIAFTFSPAWFDLVSS